MTLLVETCGIFVWTTSKHDIDAYTKTIAMMQGVLFVLHTENVVSPHSWPDTEVLKLLA